MRAGDFYVLLIIPLQKRNNPCFCCFYIFTAHTLTPDMKKLFLSLVTMAFFISAIAQQSTFRTQYNFSQFDFPTGMVQATTGNYVFSSFVFGLSIPLGPRGGLTEIDQNGNHIRSTLYNNGAFTTSVNFNDVKKISTGGYIVTGDANSQCLLAKVPAAFGAPT